MKPANILKYTFILFVAAIYILGSILVNSTYIPEYITDIKGIYDVSSEKPNIVTRVIDGDTVEMWNGDIVRYIGIDTSEIGSKKECYGENAKTANEQLVLG